MPQSIVVEELSFYLLFGICAFFFVRVFREPKSFLTFPVLTSAIWLAYIVPQAFGILYNPIYLPEEVFENGYAKTMIVCTLCVLMGVWGWKARVAKWRSLSLSTYDLGQQYSPRRLMISGAVLTVIGLMSFISITRQTGGIIGYYSVDGNYGLDWIGSEVIAVFFMQAFLNLAVIVLFFSYYMRPRFITAAIICVALAPYVADIVILNRRSSLIFLVISVFAPAYFVRGWAPRRKMVALACVLGMFVVFTFPVIRGVFVLGGTREAVNVVGAFKQELFEGVLGGNTHKEFNNSIGIVASSDRLGEFGYGAITWNSWVKTSLPRSLLGQSIKDALSFEGGSFAEIGARAYNWVPVWFQSRSAAAILFADFWYLGCLVFFGIGYWFGRLYIIALRGNISGQMFYCAMVLLLPHWVAVGLYKAPRNVLLALILLGIVRGYAKLHKREKGINEYS